jgi:hypothetical protein
MDGCIDRAASQIERAVSALNCEALACGVIIPGHGYPIFGRATTIAGYRDALCHSLGSEARKPRRANGREYLRCTLAHPESLTPS